MAGNGKAKAKTGASPASYRRGHLTKTTKLEPSMFVEISEANFDKSSPRLMMEVVTKVEKQLQLAKDKLRRKESAAARELFRCVDRAGSSADHATKSPTKPKKQKDPRAFVASPDCGLPADDVGRDGVCSGRASYVETPSPKKPKRE